MFQRTGLIVSLGLAATLLGSCASGPMLERGGPPAPRAEITRQGQTIHLRYEMDRDAEVWAFYDSALMSEVRQPWRPTQWRVLTPGVRLVRAGAYDALVNEAGGPVPREIDIEITPKGVDLEAEYPTLVFSNGAVALPTRQASVFPMDSLEELAALSSDLNAVELDVGPTKVTWRDKSGPVLYQGERRPMLITQFERSYVLLGDADVTRDDGLTAVIDPALPKWMADTLSEAAPATGRWYRQRLGSASAGAEKPVLMAAWNGPAERMSSMGGSVLPGLIVMNFEGRGIVEPDDEVRERALWFIAHEAAHFWLGQTVRYEYAREAWITEGGADLLAVRALKARDPAYDAKAELQREVDDCIRLARQPVNTAGDRGEHRAYYACGAVFALAAEAAQKRRTGGDYVDFVRETLRRNRDGVVNEIDWFTQFIDAGGSPEVADRMRLLLTEGAADPAPVVAAILADVGVTLSSGRVILR